MSPSGPARRNGMRQPHSMSAASGRTLFSTRATVEPTNRPVAWRPARASSNGPAYRPARTRRETPPRPSTPPLREPLHATKHEQQNGRSDADGGEGGQAPDEECRTGHEEDGNGKRPLAALLVAHVAPENSTDGTKQERQSEHCNVWINANAGSSFGKNTCAITTAKYEYVA